MVWKCDLYGTTAGLGDLFPIESGRRCAEQWKAQADLTSEIAMGDLDEVRAALGYDRVNLFGTSYGMRTAQVFMRQFPARVRTVILKGVTPMAVPLTVPMARDAQRSLDLLFEDCAADAQCHAAFPKLKEEFESVFQRLETSVEVELPTGAGEKKERASISRAAIAPSLRSILQSIESAAGLPLLIHQAAHGDYVPLAKAALAIRRGFPKVVKVGAFLLITSIEDVAITDPKELAQESRGTFLRDDYFKQLQRAAAVFPRRDMPPDYRAPVQSDIPTLLISGFVDPATPPAGADEVARHLSKSRHVVARYGSHAYGGMSPCADRLMAEFIAKGSAESLDTNCLDEIRRPAFLTKPKPDTPKQAD